MRFSTTVTLAVCALSPVSLAAPVRRGFLSSIGNAIGNIAHNFQNATLSGIENTIGQSIANPQLTAARVQVVTSLGSVASDLANINKQASANNNAGVVALVNTAQGGVTAAQTGINNIGQALISNNKPSTTDQRNVAIGIKTARDAVNQMAAAITTPDPALTSTITRAQTDVTTLSQGGQAVLAASNLSFSDLGLPANFAAPSS